MAYIFQILAFTTLLVAVFLFFFFRFWRKRKELPNNIFSIVDTRFLLNLLAGRRVNTIISIIIMILGILTWVYFRGLF